MQKEVNTKVPAVRTQYEIFLKAVNRKKDVLYFSHTGGGSIIFYEQMKARYEFLEEKMKSLEKELEQFPKGKLRICRNGGKYRWLYTKESGTPPEVISQHDEFFAKQMAKKQFLLNQLNQLNQESQAVLAYLKKFPLKESLVDKKLYSNPEFQRLLEGQFVSSDEYVEDWKNQSYKRNQNHPETLRFRTISGNTVRSKSEAIIDAALFSYGIPYFYECPLKIGGEILYPDFTILHPKSKKIYYWEHNGKMDDKRYVDKVCYVTKKYCYEGIVPGINLIMSYETKEHPLDPMEVDSIIQKYFGEGK